MEVDGRGGWLWVYSWQYHFAYGRCIFGRFCSEKTPATVTTNDAPPFCNMFGICVANKKNAFLKIVAMCRRQHNVLHGALRILNHWCKYCIIRGPDGENAHRCKRWRIGMWHCNYWMSGAKIESFIEWVWKMVQKLNEWCKYCIIDQLNGQIVQKLNAWCKYWIIHWFIMDLPSNR